jgi:streptogramin lyase
LVATLDQRGGSVGEYRIHDQTRSGTAGTIFRAEQPSLSRPVLLQVASPAGGKRFLDVARVLAKVDHPHLLDVYDVDVDGEVPFAVMREPPGRSLREVIAVDGPLGPRRVVRLGSQLASALEALDTAGVSFERVSPDDVFLDGSGEAEHAYLAPLGELVDADTAGPVLESNPSRSAAALSGLLSSVAGPSSVVAAGETPSAVAEAARRALAAERRRRRPLLAVAVLAAVAVAVAVGIVVATRPGGGPAAAQPVARKVATIPLGASPRSIAVSGDAVWVATANGTALRIDPQSNEVVGQPIPFGKPQKGSNLTIRAGAGYVFALDGSAGQLTRIDPRRNAVTGRLHLGGVLNGATVADGLVWVLRSSPDGVQPPSYELVRVDPKALEPVGKPYAVGPSALDVEVRGGVAWVSNGGNGTVTRVDPRRNRVKTVLAAASPNDSELVGSTLWVPDFWGDSVVPLDTSLARPPSTVVRGMHHPFSVVATGGALWVAALAGASTNAPPILDRIDPASKRVVGRPVPLAQEVGWISSGFGSIWVQDQGANALVRYDPTHLSQQAPPSTRRPSGLRILRPGPLAPGEWRSADPTIPIDLRIDRAGWMSIADQPHGAELGRFDVPETTVMVMAPTQLFLADGRVEAIRSAGRIVRALHANRHLVVRALPSAAVGGVRATRLEIQVKPFKGYPTFCPEACVPIFGFPNNTQTANFGLITRASLVPFRGKLIVVLEQTDSRRGSLTTTGALVRSLRIRN